MRQEEAVKNRQQSQFGETEIRGIGKSGVCPPQRSRCEDFGRQLACQNVFRVRPQPADRVKVPIDV